MGLPQTREQTFIAGASQIPGAVMNKIQDEIIVARAQRTLVIDAAAAAILAGWTVSSAFGLEATAAAGGAIRVPIPLELNERIISYTVVWETPGVLADLEASLRCTTAEDGEAGPVNDATLASDTLIESGTDAGIVQTQTHVLASPRVVDVDQSYHVRVVEGGSAGTKFLYRVEIVIDRAVA
jgi:hypothetical protein